ncbi:MAG: exonuclease SbcCD subunit D [Bacillota bacterium]|nr:exonuclease SbcCD subunit D [Bacillota bacterium]
MKIIHTADWHIGKLVHGLHMTEDQEYLLKQFVRLVDDEKPDVVIIAGDIYDRTVPPVEAVELMDRILTEILIDCKTKVIMITGNHDSSDRVGFANRILKNHGLYIRTNLEKSIDPIVIGDEFGTVNFYPIPFIEPIRARKLYDDDNIKTYDDSMKAIMKEIDETIDKSERNVCITHGFVIGTENLETSESERPLTVGGSDYVSADYFDDFDYVALGHLHGPQKVKSEKIRYSGSLMKYSFSEALQNKSIAIINMDENGETTIEKKVLNPIRDMRIIKGNLNDLIDEEVYSLGNTDDYIMAVITDEGELVDPISKLRTVYPNILKLSRESKESLDNDNKTSASGDFLKKSPDELFDEFYTNTGSNEYTKEKREIVENVVDEINYIERVK